jgi:succinyl-CoA synthetase alpha subunit
MSILIDKNTRLIVQGITGRDGGFHTAKMKAYGTNIVGGTSPGKGREMVEGIPVFDTVREAVSETDANTSVIFVPAPFAKDAMMEAADAGVKLIICITEGVPTLDVVEAYRYISLKEPTLSVPIVPV